MRMALFFAIYSALLAYMVGVGDSLSFLIMGTKEHSIIFGSLFGFGMSYLLYRGISALKKYERIGVVSLLCLIILTVAMYSRNVNVANLFTVDTSQLFLPIGVILFSLIEFYSLPEVRLILTNRENLLKKAIILGTIIPIIFYVLFTMVVVGIKGSATPEISTFALGNIFVLVGIIAMFTSYLSLGTSLVDSYRQDLYLSKQRAWFLTAIMPIAVFIFLNLIEFVSFISILSVGGVIAGGTMVLLVLIITQRAQQLGDRTPEYIEKRNGFVVSLLGLIFILGIVIELTRIFI